MVNNAFDLQTTMKGVICMAKKGVVKDWTKNAASAIKYTAVDLTSDSAPFLTNTISNAASAIKDMVDWIKRNSPEKSSNSNKEPFLKRAINNGKGTFKIAMDDIKSGNLNFDGINKKFSNGIDAMFDDFGSEPDFDFGDEDDLFGSSSDSDSSESSSSFEGLTSEMYASGLEVSTRANIDAIAESSSFISENTMRAAQASTKQMVAANFANTARLSSQLSDIILNTKATNDNMASLVEFNNNSLSPFLSQAQQYMENTEQTLNDIKAILETRMPDPAATQEKHSPKDFIRGGFDFKGYLNKAKGSSIVTMLTMMYSPVFSMLNNMGVPLPDFIKDDPMVSMGIDFNPIKSLAKYALPSLFGDKSKLKSLDTIMEDMVLKLMHKLSQDETFGEFGQRLYKGTLLDKSNYEKGAVVWSGKDSKVLQDVIPSYLAKIESNTLDTSKNLTSIVDILHRTLMGKNGMVKAYGDDGKLLVDENGRTFYDKIRIKNAVLAKQGKYKNEEIERHKIQYKDKVDENGNLVYNKNGTVKRVRDKDLVYTVKGVKAKKFKPKEAAEIRSRKVRTTTQPSSESRIWNSDTGNFTDMRTIKKDYDFELSRAYQPYTDFFDLVVQYFNVGDKSHEDDRNQIAALVTTWANKFNDVDAEELVDAIIAMEQFNTTSGEDITPYERSHMAAALRKAKKEFIANRSAMIDRINSGTSIYRYLSDTYIDEARSGINFMDSEEFIRDMTYKSGDKAKIEAYEKEQALKKLKHDDKDLPFAKDSILSKKQFIAENGKYSDQEGIISKSIWKFRKFRNDAKIHINTAAEKIRNNTLDKSAGKGVAAMYDSTVKLFTDINEMLDSSKDKKLSAEELGVNLEDKLLKWAKDEYKKSKNQAAVGADRIPEEGWWLLHPNERVLTEAQADRYDELENMLRHGELVSADKYAEDRVLNLPKDDNGLPIFQGGFGISDEQMKADRKLIKWYNRQSKKYGNADLLDYHDLRDVPEDQLSQFVSKIYGKNASIAGMFNNGREAIIKKANGKYERFMFKRRKPQTIDEEEKLEDFTNKAVEKAETREDAEFAMQQEMTENIRSIAANTAGEAERSAAKEKAENANSSKDTVKTLLGKLSGFLFGDKNDYGFFTDGPLANIANKVVNSKRKLFHTLFGKGYVDIEGNVVEGKDVTKSAKDVFKNLKDSASETLFGKKKTDATDEDSASTKKARPSSATHDKVPVYDKDGNPVLTKKGKQKFKWVPKGTSSIEEATEEVADEIREAGEETVEVVFGEDVDTIRDATEKANKNTVVEYAKKLGKGALIGGIAGATLGTSLGVIPSMFIPGGPIAGALLGLGGSILSQTETFKKFVFGDLDEKTGERSGGLITKSMQERFKKTLPFVAGGAALGLLQKFFLPAASLIPGPGGALMNIFFGSGPIAGALLGLGGGLIASSETFRKKIFGEEDEDGELTGGLLSKPAEAIRKILNKNGKTLKSAGMGAALGLVGNKLAAVKFGTSGLLYQVFGAGGPIGAALIGSAIGIATQSERFQEMIFGKDTGEVDENGKPIRDKSGLLHRFLNVFTVNVVRPIAEWGEYARDSFINWLKHDLGDHVKGIFRPLQDALGDAAEKVDEVFDGLGTFVAKAIGMAMHPVKKLLPALLKTGVNMGLGALTGAAKMVGGTISAPLKTLDFFMNGDPLFASPGGKHYRKENADFRNDIYGGGVKGAFRNWADFMFNHDKWLDKRQEWGSQNLPGEENSGFFYYNKRRDAKLDKKDVTDEYKRKRGITKRIQKWAAADEFNSSIILTDEEFKKRKKFLSDKGVDTEGWTNQDLIDFMYSNDEKRKTQQQADEDAKLQREANQAEIETKEEIRTFKDIFIDFKNRLFNKDTVEAAKEESSGTEESTKKARPSSATHNKEYIFDEDGNPVLTKNGNQKFKWVPKDNTVTKQESEKLERKIETGDSVKIGDMPSEGAKEVLSALQANDHNKAQKAEEEAAKKKADAKTAEAQALGKKKDGDKSDDEKKTFKEKVAAYVENKGGVLATISDFVGKAAGLGIAALVATKIDWSGVFKTIKGAVSGLIDSFKEKTEESRTYIDEETGEEVIAPSALDAQVVVPRLANSAFRFATGTNLSALLYNITGGKAGGLFGAASSKLGKVTMNAMAKPIAKITGAVGKAASNGKFYAEAVAKYGDDILKGSKLTGAEKFFTMIYKALDKMKGSKALQKIAGGKLGKAIDSLVGAFKKISTKFGKILGKNSGKLADAAAAGAAKTGASAAKDIVPVLNIIIWSAGAIAGSLNVANLFHLADEDDADIWMRTVAAIIGFLKSTMVGSLIDIIAEILKDAADFDLWNFIAVPCYKALAPDEKDDALDASMKAVEDACEQYNQEHGTNLSVTEYNDQIRNRTLGTKILGVLGLDSVSKAEAQAKKDADRKQTSTYTKYNDSSDTSDSSGYGTGISAIGYGIDHYTQNDPRWGRRKYATRRNGLSTSMATGGCGPTALANAASQLGVNVNPVQVANMARTNGYTADGGTNARMFTDGVRQLGLKSTNIGRGGVRSALRRGQKVILSGKGSDGIYTKAGHIISARGIDSRGNAIVDDPLKRKSRRIPISKLTSNSTHAWAIGYGPDLTVEEANQKFGSPAKFITPDSTTNGAASLYYAYQQRHYDDKNPERNWGDLSFIGKERTSEDIENGVASIGDVGCLMTAIASLVSNVTKRDHDPLSFVKLYGGGFAAGGDILASPSGKRDYVIDLLNNEFKLENNSLDGPFLEYLSSVDGELRTGDTYAYAGGINVLNHTMYPRIINNAVAARMLGPAIDARTHKVDKSNTKGGLFGGYPVVLFGDSVMYSLSPGKTHAILIKGVTRKYDPETKKYYFATTKYDPGKNANNGKTIPLSSIVNDTNLKHTKRIITFSSENYGYDKKDWTDYAARIDDTLGTTHDDLSTNAYSDTYDVKSNGVAEAKEPTNILEASANFIKGLVSIASNIFSALGTKDFMYKSIYSDKTSSLIGGNGFNESVRDLTQGLSDASDVYGSDWSYRVPETFSAESVSAINSMDYKNTAEYLGVTPELLTAINGDKSYSTGVGSDYQNIPSLPSGKLPLDVLTEMKAKLFPMIARHESGGTIDNVITDTNKRVALGIGGFNASNASEVMYRLANKIDSLIAQANEEGFDSLGDIDGADKFGVKSYEPLDIETWASYSSFLKDKAKLAETMDLSTSTKSKLSSILRQSGEYAKEVEIAVLDDLLNKYMQEPVNHYNSGDLLDPRSIMLMAEFGGYGPAHLGYQSMWSNIKQMMGIYNTEENNVRAVRDGMINYYKNNVSSFTSGHANRISETAKTLLDPTNAAGFVPDSIMPNAEYGITIENVDNFMNKVYSLLETAAINGEYDSARTDVIVKSIQNTVMNQYKNGGIKLTPEELVKDAIKRYPITKSKTTTSTSYVNLPMMANSHDYGMPTTADNADNNALLQTAMALSVLSSPVGIVGQTKKTSGTGSMPSFSSKPQMPLRNVGNGPSDYYSDADIYTDEESIAKYNANNPLPVKMNTRPIESRVDVVIQILRQILQVCNANKSAEGYGTKAANPIGNSQKVRNAGIDIADRMPLYTKDMNEVHVDPLRQLFQTIAASPR